MRARRLLTAIALVTGATVAGAAQWTVTEIDGDPVMRGLPRDAIPAIDNPVFVPAARAGFMRGDEYVIGITDGTTTKAYSALHLNAHEIVNDTLGGRAIAVTWCPLCYTGIVYDRVVEGRTLSFGVSGLLWRENLVMYDRETDSWWSQASGRAIQGTLRGRELTMVSATMVTWQTWLQKYPQTLVLEKTGSRSTIDVYARYHASSDLGVTGRMRPGAGRIAAKTRIVGFRLDGRAFAVELSRLPSSGILIATAAETPVVVAGVPDGSGARIFRAGGHAFGVENRNGQSVLVDEASRSAWDAFEGRARQGAMAGSRLEEVPASMSYWFAWQAFFPSTTVVR